MSGVVTRSLRVMLVEDSGAYVLEPTGADLLVGRSDGGRSAVGSPSGRNAHPFLEVGERDVRQVRHLC